MTLVYEMEEGAERLRGWESERRPRDPHDLTRAMPAEGDHLVGRWSSRPTSDARTDCEEVRAVQAAVGDRIVVRGRRVGAHGQSGVILAVGGGGQPPYFVRWDDDQEGLFFPGSDAVVEHYPMVEQPG